MKKFWIDFMEAGPRGPVGTRESVEAPTKKAATDWARSIAKERGARVMQILSDAEYQAWIAKAKGR